MKITKQFRKSGNGDLRIPYNEEISSFPVFFGRVSCDKKSLEEIFGHIPEVFTIEIEEGLIK